MPIFLSTTHSPALSALHTHKPVGGGRRLHHSIYANKGRMSVGGRREEEDRKRRRRRRDGLFAERWVGEGGKWGKAKTTG